MVETLIEDVHARKIYDSRGNPTIEVEVITADGFGRASAPSGASTGIHEAVPFPKGSVDVAVKLVNDVIAQKLIGMDATNQIAIDRTLREIDGTDNFSNIGGAAAIATSIATAKAAASSLGIPLFQYIGGALVREMPYPLGNIIGGGRHAGDRSPNVQEFLVIPVGAKNYVEAVEVCFKVHREVGRLIKNIDGSFAGGRGDEGAWAANISDEDALRILRDACEKVQSETGFKVVLGVDMAASSMWNSKMGVYVLRREDKVRTREEQLNYVLEIAEKYDLRYVEDPLHEEDFDGFSQLIKSLGHKSLICGDDLFTTNVKRIKLGLNLRAANAVIIKPNQVGTLSDTYEAVNVAKSGGLTPVMSHRSGETEDDFVCHLAIGLRCPIIKIGVLGGERIVKHNELIRIEESLGNIKSMAELPPQLTR